MACGNGGEEGESGVTLNTLMVAGPTAGFKSVSVDKTTVYIKSVEPIMVLTMTFGSTHGVDNMTNVVLRHISELVPGIATIGSGSNACTKSSGYISYRPDKLYDK